MIEIFLYMAAGGLLVAFILWLVFHGSRTDTGLEPIASTVIELPPRALADRIFSDTVDAEFVSKNFPPALQEMYRKERRSLALAWLKAVHHAGVQLYRVHVSVARGSSVLNPRVELQVACELLGLLVTCYTLYALVWLRGPHSLSRLVGRVLSLTTQLSMCVGPASFRQPEIDRA